jgi:hypothetical protein
MDINYSNGFTQFGQGLQAALTRQDAERRQKEQDAIIKEREARLKAHDDAALAEAKARTAELAAVHESEAAARKVNMAKAVSGALPANTALDNMGDTANTLREGGLGALLKDDVNGPQSLASHRVAAPMIGLGASPEAQAAAPVMAAQDDPAKALQTTYMGDAKQQEDEAHKVVLKKLLDDPKTPADVRLWVQGQLGGANVPAELLKDDKKPRDLFMKRDGTLLLIGPNGQPQPLPADFVRRPEDVVHAEPAPPGGAGNVQLSLGTDAIDLMAAQYLQTGALPALGQGAAAANMRKQLIERAAAMAKEQGINPVANGADLTADKAALAQAQKQYTSVKSFKETARKNIDVLKGVLKDTPDLGFTFLNQPWRALLGTRDPRMARFKTALGTVQPEIARILNSATLTGVNTVHAQEEVERMLNPNATGQQLLDALTVLEQDMGNRESSMQDQIRVVQGRIGSRNPLKQTPGVVSGPPADAPRVRKYNPATGKLE